MSFLNRSKLGVADAELLAEPAPIETDEADGMVKVGGEGGVPASKVVLFIFATCKTPAAVTAKPATTPKMIPTGPGIALIIPVTAEIAPVIVEITA